MNKKIADLDEEKDILKKSYAHLHEPCEVMYSFIQSINAKGCCYGNACTERFFSSLKRIKHIKESSRQ